MSVLDAFLAVLAVSSIVISVTAYRFPWRRRLTDHADRLAILEDSMEVIRGLAKRTAARHVKREQRAVDDGEPDWRTDPDAWKSWKQREIDRAKTRSH